MAKILVIDDNIELLELISTALERKGRHRVTISADGNEGLSKALSTPPDLIISDVMMPGISGHEICRQLRANSATSLIPILIITARGQAVDRQAAMNAGADDYMTKPLDMKDLLNRINNLLTKSPEKPISSTQTMALLSLRGGVGVTTLAVNLAATLAQSSSEKVCLLDLCPSSGHAALQLGLRPDPNWSKLSQSNTPNEATVEACLLTHTSGLQIIASPFLPAVGPGLSRAAVRATLRVLGQQFAVVVVDTPSTLNETTLAVLETATVVGLVITAEAPSIQTAVGTLRALKRQTEQFPDKFQQLSLHIILNQIMPNKQFPLKAIERTLKRPLLGSIPFDSAQAQALTQGAPLALKQTGSSLAQAVQKLSRQMLAIGG